MQPVRANLPGGRVHFQHGPIDLVIGADGSAAALARAHDAAWARFQTVLQELVDELPLLRQPVAAPPRLRGDRAAGAADAAEEAHATIATCPVRGAVARRMWAACAPHAAVFITPMAAVAGAVAEEIVACYAATRGVDRAWVNNGGDIALHLTEGTTVAIGVVADIADLYGLDASFHIHAESPTRGIATSGWRGRSFSLGIADSATVLARTAAQADACATLVANAVDADDPRIERRPANTLKDDTDLADRLVTTHVPPLPAATIAAALERGRQRAERLQRAGHLHAALLACQGRRAGVDPDGVTLPIGSVFA